MVSRAMKPSSRTHLQGRLHTFLDTPVHASGHGLCPAAATAPSAARRGLRLRLAWQEGRGTSRDKCTLGCSTDETAWPGRLDDALTGSRWRHWPASDRYSSGPVQTLARFGPVHFRLKVATLALVLTAVEAWPGRLDDAHRWRWKREGAGDWMMPTDTGRRPPRIRAQTRRRGCTESRPAAVEAVDQRL
jgi:hypothetical protein